MTIIQCDRCKGLVSNAKRVYWRDIVVSNSAVPSDGYLTGVEPDSCDLCPGCYTLLLNFLGTAAPRLAPSTQGERLIA